MRQQPFPRKAAKAIVDFTLEHDCCTIVVFGANKQQKKNCKMDHVNAQNFVQIPFLMLRLTAAAKCEKYGI